MAAVITTAAGQIAWPDDLLATEAQARSQHGHGTHNESKEVRR